MTRLAVCALLAVLGPAWIAAQDAKKSNYYPLAKGTRWEFQAEVAGQKLEASSEITKSEVTGGKTVATAEIKVGPQTITEELSSDEKGVYRSSFQGLKLDTPLTVFKYPPKAGTTWTEKVKGGGMEIEAKFTVKEAEKVTVPAGNYDKAFPVEMVITAAGQMITATNWFAEGVGPVKQLVEVGGMKITADLKKFTPGK
jgi:hypothetical protein